MYVGEMKMRRGRRETEGNSGRNVEKRGTEQTKEEQETKAEIN